MKSPLEALSRNIDILSVRPTGIMLADNRAEVTDARTTGKMPVGRTGWKPMIPLK
jgi:hypothetical protein